MKKAAKHSVNLRLDSKTYTRLASIASGQNRTVTNLAETFVLQKLQEIEFVDDDEMKGILLDKNLLSRLERGSQEAKKLKGKFV